MAERRIDPEDGNAYTWDEMLEYYGGKFNHKAITAYWKGCRIARKKQAKSIGPSSKEFLALKVKLEKLEAEAAQLRREVGIVQGVIGNHKIFAFTSDGGEGGHRFSDGVMQAIRRKYKMRCAFCGTRKGVLSCAHIAQKDKGFNVARNGKAFIEPFKVDHHRNGILLCKDVPGACHDLFDEFYLALVPPVLGEQWKLLCFSSGWRKYAEASNSDGQLASVCSSILAMPSVCKIVCIDPSFQFDDHTVFKRVLAERLEATMYRRQKIPIDLVEHCAVVASISAGSSEATESEAGIADSWDEQS
jgi:hypothetical protein